MRITAETESAEDAQINGEKNLDGAYSHSEGSEVDSHHGADTDYSMMLKVGGVALLLIAGFAFALYCRLRRARIPKKHVHSRVASGIAFEDEVDEDEEVLEEIQIGREMVHTGYGYVQPGSIMVRRTDEMYMLPH